LTTHFDDNADFAPADWLSQAEAAQLRGVTRQAIARLIKRGRLRTLVVGGRTLVSRADVEAFVPRPAGRPKGASR
jgi:excisionase family DNA binding protein